MWDIKSFGGIVRRWQMHRKKKSANFRMLYTCLQLYFKGYGESAVHTFPCQLEAIFILRNIYFLRLLSATEIISRAYNLIETSFLFRSTDY